jgi:Icc protein
MQKKIAFITDTHLDDTSATGRGINPRKNLEAILEHIAANPVDDIVFGGDIGEPATYPWLFEKLQEYKPGFKAIMGNHDILSEMLQYYSSMLPVGTEGLYYVAEDELYKYIYLDSWSSAIGPAQLAWLEGEIRTIKKIILFIHHPILGVPTAIDGLYPLQGRDTINELLQQCRQNVTVFCGHYHMPDKRTDRKITQYITPAVSFQVNKYAASMDIKVSSFGYRVIILSDNGVSSKLITNQYDYFSPAP